MKNRYFLKSIIWIYYIFRFIFSILHIFIIELPGISREFLYHQVFSQSHFYCNNIYANAIRYRHIAMGYGYIYIYIYTHIHIHLCLLNEEPKLHERS